MANSEVNWSDGGPRGTTKRTSSSSLASSSAATAKERPKKQLSLSLKWEQSQHFCFVTEEKVNTLCEGVVPVNTYHSKDDIHCTVGVKFSEVQDSFFSLQMIMQD